MSFPGHFGHFFFVDLDAQTGSGGQGDKAVLIVEDLGIGQIIQKVAALIVVDAQGLLLNEGVGRGGVQLQTGGQRDGAQGQWGATATS